MTNDFNNVDIFNKEDSQYDNSNYRDNYTYNTIINKINNNLPLSDEEFLYYIKENDGFSGILLDKLINADTISNDILEKLSKNNFKYKVSSKEELEKIVDLYSEKKPIGSLNWIDTSNIADMSELFRYSKYNGDISEWDVTNVTNMACMFACSKFNGEISNWDVSNVTTMACMFAGSQFNKDICKWNVSKVKSMAGMFAGSQFNQDISDWDVSNVKSMAGMFAESPLKKIPWDDVSNVPIKDHMLG